MAILDGGRGYRTKLLKGTPPRMIQAKFGLNWPSGFRGEDFLKSLQMDDGRQLMAITPQWVIRFTAV